MKTLKFEWGKKKNNANIKKHGISFDDARTTFYDEHALQFFDPDHSDEEDWFILLGTNHKLRTLVVCHCFREAESLVRIISARKADKDEKDAYWRLRK
ncbi:MAG: BrnT family toxin [Pseudohongiellaceae bacterium]